MRYLRSKQVVWLFALLWVTCLPVFGQTAGKGVIKGVVRTTEATGGVSVVPEVTVTLSNSRLLSGGRTTQSDDNGEFQFTGLVDGEYQVKFERQGFQPVQSRAVVSGGQAKVLEIQLTVAALTGEITVETNQDVINVQESSNVGTVSQKFLQNAPLASERFQDALPLLPGVVRGPDGLISIKGTRSSQSGLLVNSTNVTDPATGNYAFSLPIDAVSSLHVISNPYSAEYGKFAGGVTSIETRQGSDQWKFQLQNFFPRLRRRNGSIVGMEAVVPRITVSGPLGKRVSMLQSWEYRFVRTRIPSLPELRNDQVLETFDSFTQVDAQLNERHHLTTIFSLFPQNLEYANLNTFNPRTVAANFRQRGFFTAIQEKAITGRGVLESSFSVKQFEAHVFANSSRPMVIFPEANSGGYFNKEDRFSRRYEFSEVYNFPVYHGAGEHNLKAGVIVDYTQYHATDVNSNVIVRRPDGTISERLKFFGSPYIFRNEYEISGYFQDHWNLSPSFTLDLGVRIDRDGIGEQNNVAPRVGYVWLPFKTHKTVVRGGFGLFFDKIPLLAGTFDQIQGRKEIFFPAGLAPRVMTRFNTIRPGGLRAPLSIGIDTEVDQQLTSKWLLRLAYEQRDGFRDLVIDPIGPEPFAPAAIQLSNAGRQYYREFQITANYRLLEKSMLFFSYVRSRATGDLNDLNAYFGNFAFPVVRSNERGRLSTDAPHRFLFWGDLTLPKDIVVSPVYEIRKGFPFSRIDQDQDFVGLRNAGGRFPKFQSFDVQITKGVQLPVLGKRYKTRIGLKVFNIFNHWNPRDVQNNIDSPLFGTFFNGVERTFRGKFTVEF